MTVSSLAEKLGLTKIIVPAPDREVTGGYAGDLLSWVMGRAKSGDAWVTIMSNLNIVAVAALADTAAIVLTEGVMPEKEVAAAAEARGVNILGCGEPSYETCCRIRDLL